MITTIPPSLEDNLLSPVTREEEEILEPDIPDQTPGGGDREAGHGRFVRLPHQQGEEEQEVPYQPITHHRPQFPPYWTW